MREEPLFTTVEGIPIYHGDKYWVATSEERTGYNRCVANRKFDYNDGVERFSSEQTVDNAIEVFKWLNNESA